MKSRITIFHLSSSFVVIIGIVLTIYALRGAGIACHYDEWVGRGLYPAVAMGFGADLYEPQTGPHVTLYGVGMALFYLPAALASNPTGAIWIAFFLNLLGLLLPLFYLLFRLLSGLDQTKTFTAITATGLSILTLGIFASEPTTFYVFRIHADLPAFSFLLISLCFFDAYLMKNRRIFLHIASFSPQPLWMLKNYMLKNL